jgi:hypothetical protein
MSDPRLPFVEKAKRWLKTKFLNVKAGYRSDKYVIYPNWTVFYVPDGAIDPFHSFIEDPQKIVSLMKAKGFQRNDMVYNNPGEVFICFTKDR